MLVTRERGEMRLGVSWVVSTVLVVLLPIYVPFIYDLGRNKQWKKFLIHLVAVLLIASSVFALGWYGVASSTAPPRKTLPSLTYLDKDNLEQEAALRTQGEPHAPPRPTPDIQVMKVKFDEAQYAQGKRDFDRALKLYEDIDRGSDENGKFGDFACSCVLNNMAIVYFWKQGDRGFRASSLLFRALELQPKPQYTQDVIKRNIDELDRFLNEVK